MASVEPNRRGRGWVVRWRDESGRQRKRTVPKKVDADRLRSSVEHQLHTGTYVDASAGRTTFRTYAESWRAAQPHRHNTAIRTASQLAVHAYPVFGNRPLASIRPSEIQAWVAGLSLAASSVRPAFSTVRAIFAAAVRDRIIPRTPVERIALPELPRRQVVPLTGEQVAALVDAVPPRYRALVVLGAGTGLRPGELFGVQPGDVDWLRRTIKVERQVQLVNGRPEVAPLKNRPSYRTIPAADVVLTALSEHLKAYPAQRDQYIFRTPDGAALGRTRFGESVWRPARTRAGLPDVGLHALRHHFASVLIAAGQSVKVVSVRLGHGNAAQTLGTYAHLFGDDEDRTRRVIEAALGGHVPAVCPAQVVNGAPPQVNRGAAGSGPTSSGNDARGPPTCKISREPALSCGFTYLIALLISWCLPVSCAPDVPAHKVSAPGRQSSRSANRGLDQERES